MKNKKKKKKGELALCTPYATGNQDLVSALRCNLLWAERVVRNILPRRMSWNTLDTAQQRTNLHSDVSFSHTQIVFLIKCNSTFAWKEVKKQRETKTSFCIWSCKSALEWVCCVYVLLFIQVDLECRLHRHDCHRKGVLREIWVGRIQTSHEIS